MSASSKKKIRKEQKELKLTERQRREQKENKKLKIYSIAFTALIIAIILVTVTVLVWQFVDNAGLVEKWTVALKIGDHKIDCVEMNYYYRYAISAFMQNGGNSLSTITALYGVDMTKPLDQQQYYSESRTWADYFMDEAVKLATSDYVMADAAAAAGFTLSEAQESDLQDEFYMVETQALSNGYTDLNEFVRAYYGNGSDYKSYQEFIRRNFIAEAYRIAYAEEIVVPEDQITAYNDEHYNEYSSFTYHTYTLTFDSFQTLLGGGVEDEAGTVTYTDEQKEAAKTATKTAADSLTSAKSLDEFNAGIGALEVNKDKDPKPTSTPTNNVLYSSVPEEYQEWMADSNRKEGDIKVFDRITTSYNENEEAVETVSGYVVVYYVSRNDNTDKLDNVRHIFVALDSDEDTGEISTSDQSSENAKATATSIYEEWKNGGADEATFIQLVTEHTNDREAPGGLYENVSPYDNYYSGTFSNAARDWAVDPARKPGDVEVVPSDNGCHVMYYIGESEENYRHFSIESLLRERLHEEWYNAAVSTNNVSVVLKNTKPIDTTTAPYVTDSGEEQ